MSYLAMVYNALHSPAGLAVVVIALLAGLWMINRQPAANLSQRLMRWRVGLQFTIICAILIMAAFFRH